MISCKHDFEKPYWNTDISTPIAFSQMSILNIANDSTISFDTLGDQRLSFIYLQKLIDFKADSLIYIDPISTTKNVKLDSINFSDTRVTHSVSMGQLAASVPLGNLLFPDGGQAVIPAYANLLNDTFPIDANAYFETMTFSEGFIDLSIHNGLPTDLSNVILELRNKDDINTIISMNIPLLTSGQTEIATESLAGKTLLGDLEAEILSADIVGTSPNAVDIDYQDALEAKITIRDIKVEEGIAIFPTQEIFNEDTVVSFDIGDIKLNKVLVDEGGVEVVGVSTIQDTLKIEYKIPGTTLNGKPFEFYFELPPAPIGGSISVTKFFDFSNYEIDMTGKYYDTINTIYTESRGWIDSSGVITNISLSDSVFNTITIKEIKPKIAWGYLGNDTLSESHSIDFSTFSNFSGEIDLTQLDVSLNTHNFIGASADVFIQNFNSQSNQQTINLQSNILATPFYIPSAQENSTSSFLMPMPSTNSLVFNEENSNIDEILESKPQRINLDVDFILNPDGNQNNGFFFKEFGLKSDLEINIPLSLSAKNISFKDTANLSLKVDHINDGYFTILAQNNYPLEAQLFLTLLDQNNRVLERLSSQQFIQASEVKPDGRTLGLQSSELLFHFQSISESLNQCHKIAFEAVLNTPENPQYVSLYSDYFIDLKLIANFNYTID
jgi:hypothetical protein